MRGTVARIGAESVRLLSGAGSLPPLENFLPPLENFRCLYAAITANPSSASRFTGGAFGFLTFTRCAIRDQGGGKRRAVTRGRIEPIKRSPGRCSEASDRAPCAQKGAAARFKRIPAETAVKRTFGSSTGWRADSRRKLAVGNL